MDELGIGRRIRRARQAAGLSQEALARALDVSVFTVSRYERDAVPISDGRVEQIASALGVDTTALLNDKARS